MLQEAKNLVDLPALGKGDAMLINGTVRENLFVCQPQHQNMHGRIFGGFLMRWALASLTDLDALALCKRRREVVLSTAIHGSLGSTGSQQNFILFDNSYSGGQVTML